MSDEFAIGIDLGTTNSCVAVFKDGVVEVIPNELEKRTTPSVITITKDNTRFVGNEAKQIQNIHLENTIYESKRLIGRKYREECIQDRMRHWQFKVVEAEAGNPKISIPQNNKKTKCFHPEEISGMILEKMKLIAENYLQCPITKAVITVPAYFNDNQRQATIDAAKLANLEVLKIMNEPTAAAFAYIFQNRLTEKPSNTLVFDLGGGTFDVSIIYTNGKEFIVKAVDGNPDLGGADFDMLIYNKIVDIIQRQAKQKIDTKRQAARINAQCTRVKEELSTALSADFDILNIIDNFDFLYTFTREDFEKLIRFLIKKMIVVVKSALSQAKMSIKDIDNIVLVGGSTRIPAIIKSLEDFFKKEISRAINPDEAVACGAAYQAAMLTNRTKNSIAENVAVKDVTPFSLGIEAEYDRMDVIIKKNTGLPTSVTKEYTTVEDNQTALRLKVFQGEDRFTANNTQLGYFDFIAIPPAPAKEAKIHVTFNINTNGVLHVSATEKSTKHTKAIEIVINTGRMTKTDFRRIGEENKEYQQKLLNLKRTEEVKNDILNVCFDAKRTVENTSTINRVEKNKFIKETNSLIEYLETLEIHENTLQTLLIKKDKFKEKYDRFVTQF